MICRKCRHENPDDAMFCEECDHRLDQPYMPEKKISTIYLVFIALALGAVSVIFSLVLKYGWYIPVGTGAVGLFMSTYSMSRIRFSAIPDKKVPMMMTMVATGLSVIGFMVGLTMAL